MTIGERIKKKRQESKMTLLEVANILGVQEATVQRYESGEIKNLKQHTIARLADIFHTSPAYLMGWEDEKETPLFTYDNIFPVEKKKFPLLGEIACGKPIYADEDKESYVEAGADIKADFCLRAKGDSMINARILDGDIVFIRQQEMVNNGEVAAVIIDNEATLKRVYYYPESSKLVLNSENPAFEPLVYVGEELNQIRILGKAIAFQSDVR